MQDVFPHSHFFCHNPIFTRAHQMLSISHSVQTDGFRISFPSCIISSWSSCCHHQYIIAPAEGNKVSTVIACMYHHICAHVPMRHRYMFHLAKPKACNLCKRTSPSNGQDSVKPLVITTVDNQHVSLWLNYHRSHLHTKRSGGSAIHRLSL